MEHLIEFIEARVKLCQENASYNIRHAFWSQAFGVVAYMEEEAILKGDWELRRQVRQLWESKYREIFDELLWNAEH